MIEKLNTKFFAKFKIHFIHKLQNRYKFHMGMLQNISSFCKIPFFKNSTFCKIDAF